MVGGFIRWDKLFEGSPTQDGKEVAERGSFAPVVEYDDQTHAFGLPGLITEPWQAWQRWFDGRGQQNLGRMVSGLPFEPDASWDSLAIGGAAALGSVAAPKPAGAYVTSGAPMKPASPTVRAYHGTATQDSIGQFKPGMKGDSPHMEHDTPAVFFTGSPPLADEYARSTGRELADRLAHEWRAAGKSEDEIARLYNNESHTDLNAAHKMFMDRAKAALPPNVARVLGPAIERGQIDLQSIAQEFGDDVARIMSENMALAREVGNYYPDHSAVYPVDIGGNLREVDAGAFGNNFHPVIYDNLLKESKAQGYDGLALRNVADSPFGSDQQHDVFAMFNPGHVRSATTGELLYANPKESAALSAAIQGEKQAGAFGSHLPMDEASRMARAKEMGFDTDTTWYHSSLTPLEQFEPHGKFMGRWGVSGSSLTDNPEMASRYLDRYGEFGFVGDKADQPFQKNVMPLFTKAGMKIKEIDRPIAQELGLGYPLPENYQWPSQLDGYDAVMVRDAINGPGKPKGSDAELLSELGFDDLADGVMHTRPDDPGAIVGREMIVRDPNNIRSKFAAFDPAKSDSADLLAANPKEAAALGAAVQGEKQGIRAYHGSPYDFDRFDMSKMGTGEGAQAYGPGLYFAESEDVARNYREALADGYKIDGKPFNASTTKGGSADVGNYAADALSRFKGDRVQAIQWLREGGSPSETRAADMLERAQSVEPWNGRMYEVNINADPNDFLDWDAPWASQPAAVQRAMREAGVHPERNGPFGTKEIPDTPISISAEWALRDPQHMIHETLKEQSVPGIKYLDQGSRGAGQGSRNYVVFDDSLIEIVKKYGIAGAASLYGMTQGEIEQALADQGQGGFIVAPEPTVE